MLNSRRCASLGGSTTDCAEADSEGAIRRECGHRHRRGGAGPHARRSVASSGPGRAVGKPTSRRISVQLGCSRRHRRVLVQSAEVGQRRDIAQRPQLVALFPPALGNRRCECCEAPSLARRDRAAGCIPRAGTEILARPAAQRRSASRRAAPGSAGRNETPCDDGQRSRAPCTGACRPAFASPRPSCCRNRVGLSVGPQQQQCVHGRDVDSLIEQVDREDDLDPPGGEVTQRTLPLAASVSPQIATASSPACGNVQP